MSFSYNEKLNSCYIRGNGTINIKDFDKITKVCSVFINKHCFNNHTSSAITKLLKNNLVEYISFTEISFENYDVEETLFTIFEKISVKSLSINYSSFCHRLFLIMLNACSDTLEEFYMGLCTTDTIELNNGLINILYNCKNLKSIIIINFIDDDNPSTNIMYIDDMFDLFSNDRDLCNNLEKLYLEIGTYLTDTTLDHISSIIADKDSKLTEIYLYYNTISDEGISNLVDAILTSGKEIRFYIKDDTNNITIKSKDIIKKLLDDNENIDDFFRMNVFDAHYGIMHTNIVYHKIK